MGEISIRCDSRENTTDIIGSQWVVFVNNKQHVCARVRVRARACACACVCACACQGQPGCCLLCCLGEARAYLLLGLLLKLQRGRALAWSLSGPFLYVTEICIHLGLRGCFFGISLLSAWFKAKSLRIKRPSTEGWPSAPGTWRLCSAMFLLPGQVS